MQSLQFPNEFFDSIKVIDDTPCFVKAHDSKFVVIALHEHLGLIEYFIEMVSNLVLNSASIIIPDLFSNIEIESIDQQDEFSCLKLVDFNDIHAILKKCIAYARQENKTIVLMGFSVGAAFGLKLIQNFQDVSMGIFFYGNPLIKKLEPKRINCPVLIIHAEKDKIRHLSNDEMIQSIIKTYEWQPLIKIHNVDSSHGFMNHQHPNFDEKSFKHCRQLFCQYLLQIQKQIIQSQPEEQRVQSPKNQEQGSCHIF